jgi:hypothetical protein
VSYNVYVRPDQIGIPIIDSVWSTPAEASRRVLRILEEGSFGEVIVSETKDSGKSSSAAHHE